MTEVSLDLRGVPKERAYEELESQATAVLEGIDDDIAAMATMSALIHNAFQHLWTGFYRLVSPTLLRVGPYQGTLGCLEISVGQGVCGTAAAERRTLIVPDVTAFPGHITCDPRSRSEIVVPVRRGDGGLLAVLDIDSVELAAFDSRDVEGLERLIQWFARQRR
jgi:GAF domain-containing protein